MTDVTKSAHHNYHRHCAVQTYLQRHTMVSWPGTSRPGEQTNATENSFFPFVRFIDEWSARGQLACYQLVCHFKCYPTRALRSGSCKPTPNQTTNFCVARVNRVFAAHAPTVWTNDENEIGENAWRLTADGSRSHSVCSHLFIFFSFHSIGSFR